MVISKQLVLGLATVVTAVVLVWLWAARPDNYFDCVLHEMRGQPDSVLKIAQYACKERFGVPQIAAEYLAETY